MYNHLLSLIRYEIGHVYWYVDGPKWPWTWQSRKCTTLGGSFRHLGGVMYGDALIADYGPAFSGHTFKLDDAIVCVIPDRPDRQRAVAASMRQLVQAVGGDCGECRRCPIAALS